jgi:hypothetical protein
MSVRIEAGIIYLEGDCTVEDAETLAAALEAPDALRVDVAKCRHLHGAVVQALCVFHPEMAGVPMDSFTRDFVLPAVAALQAPSGRPAGSGAAPFHQ